MQGWTPFSRRAKNEKDLEEEIRFHLREEAQLRIDRGETPHSAQESARRDFGNVGLVKEVTREMWGWRSIETLMQDLSYALRQLRRSPGITMVAVITLALGIGANTAIFSIVNSFLFRPAPVPHPGELTVLAFQQKSGPLQSKFSYPDLEDIRRQTSGVFSDVIGYQNGLQGLSVDGKSARMWGNYVTGNYFAMLGLRPALGRLILPSEGQRPGADPVLVLGYSYWKQRFAGDAGIVGKRVTVNGHPFTVIGVAPAGFAGLDTMLEAQGFLPLGMTVIETNAGDILNDRGNRNLAAMARLKGGARIKDAQTELNVIASRLAGEYPKTNEGLALRAIPERLSRPEPSSASATQLTSMLFLALAALVLALACINVGNILLVRASAREREMAVRAALGAGRLRLMRQLLTESLLLALLGGALGMLLGLWSSSALGSIDLQASVPLVLNFHFDWNVFGFAFIAAALTGGIVGIVPAMRFSRGHLADVLRGSGRGVAAGRHRVRSALVIVQVGGSLMLLIVAGLFWRSLENTQRVDLGFDPNHLVNLTLDANEAGYSEEQSREFARTLLDKVNAMSGVQSATIAFSVPMGYIGTQVTVEIPDRQAPAGEPAPVVPYNIITPQYFETLRIPVVRGREFTGADTEKSLNVAVINEAMAEKYWPSQDPVGRRFQIKDEIQHTVEIVGVAKNSRARGFGSPIKPYFYVPLSQTYTSIQTLQVRTPRPPELMLAEVEKLVGTIAPGIPLFGGQTMEQGLNTLNGSLRYQIGAGLAAALGILGMILALVGLYGVVSYAAAQRTHEIGIRMALGARTGEILRMMVRQGFTMVGAGLVLGLGAALAISRVVNNFLVGVSASDPMTYAIVTLLLGLVALAACYIPARRATRIDPMAALRDE